MRKLWTSAALPSGETQLTLRHRAGPRESWGYGALSVATALGGLWLLAHGFCLFGVVCAALGGWMLFALVGALTRKEAWRVSAGAATRVLGTKQTPLRFVRRVRFEPETDSDERKLLRLLVVHGEGETQVGELWERDDDVEGLSRALGEALGVPVDPVPPPV